MALTTNTSQTTLAGNGATTVWTFPFVAGVASNISVYTLNISTGAMTLIPPANYAVFINAPATNAIWGVGGTVTYPLVGPPLALGTSIIIQRQVPVTQQTALTSGYYTPQAIEAAMDTLCMQVQQVYLRGGINRGFWATNTLYNTGDTIQDGTNGANTLNLYQCINTNTSGVWATDLANGLWQLVFNMASYITGVGNAPANSLFGNNTGSLAPGSFSSSPIISGTMTAGGFTSASGNLSIGGTSSVTGAATFGATLAVTGNFTVNTNKFTVNASTGNVSFAGTLAINTNKFTVDGSGNTVAAGTIQGTQLISTVATSTPPFVISSTTAVTNLRPDLSLVNTWTGQQNTGSTALTDGASISWNLNTQQNATLTIGGARTLANPTNMVAGGCYTLQVTQDGTGSRTLAYGTAYKFPGGVKPVLSTAAGAIDILNFQSDGTNMYGSIQKAFS